MWNFCSSAHQKRTAKLLILIEWAAGKWTINLWRSESDPLYSPHNYRSYKKFIPPEMVLYDVFEMSSLSGDFSFFFVSFV